MPRSLSGASARPSPRVLIKSLERNALHTSRIRDMVYLNGNRSSTNVEHVDHRQIARNIGMAVVAGAAVAVATVFFVLGPRADLTTVGTFIPPLLKVVFTFIILVPASIYLIRLT